MIGHFEIQPRHITIKDIEYTVQGYEERKDGTRIAEATVKSWNGDDITIMSLDTRIKLMNIISRRR